MRNKRWTFALLALLTVLAAQPVCSLAASDTAQTEVTATVESRFTFSLPSSTTVSYPNTQVVLGQFGIRDLLLYENERLAIELTRGTMTARSDAAATLPYTVAFNPPAAVDASHIGDAYNVVVTIDADAFDAATRSVYDADLVFRVRSLLTGEVVWQGTTMVTARKAQPGGDDDDDDTGGGGTGGGGTGGGGTGDGEGIPQTGDNTIIDEQTPQGGAPQLEPEGQFIPGEDVPAAQPAAFWWWWILIATLAVALLCLILFLLFRRRREKEDMTI